MIDPSKTFQSVHQPQRMVRRANEEISKPGADSAMPHENASLRIGTVEDARLQLVVKPCKVEAPPEETEDTFFKPFFG